MAKLNCRVGDLAITVRSNIPDNVGLIVRIVDICMYLDEWKDLEGPVHIWDVGHHYFKTIFPIRRRHFGTIKYTRHFCCRLYCKTIWGIGFWKIRRFDWT